MEPERPTKDKVNIGDLILEMEGKAIRKLRVIGVEDEG